MFIWIFLGLLFVMLYMKSGTPADKINRLIKQSANFAIQAQQDTAPVQAVVHANITPLHI